MDKSDLRILAGLLVASIGAVWVALVLGVALYVFRAVAGV